MIRLEVCGEVWPLAQVFTISRGSKTSADVVVCTLERDGHSGRGESMPYPRYGESVQGVVREIEGLRSAVEAGINRAELQQLLPPGAARNALDCALWDLEAKSSGKRVHELASLPTPQPVQTAYTLSLDSAEKMGEAAATNAHRPLLKIKLAGQGDLERVAAIRQHAPHSTLIVDASRYRRELCRRTGPTRCRPRRTTAARRRRRRAERVGTPTAFLRRRVLPRSGRYRRFSRTLRIRQYQARQKRRPDRGISTFAKGSHTQTRRHGRLYGRHFSGDGPRRALGQQRRIRRLGRPPAAARRPPTRPALRGQHSLPAHSGSLGLIL